MFQSSSKCFYWKATIGVRRGGLNCTETDEARHAGAGGHGNPHNEQGDSMRAHDITVDGLCERLAVPHVAGRLTWPSSLPDWGPGITPTRPDTQRKNH